jgi:hypothetical protein
VEGDHYHWELPALGLKEKHHRIATPLKTQEKLKTYI